METPPEIGTSRWIVGILEVYGTPITRVGFYPPGTELETREIRQGESELVFAIAAAKFKAMTSTLLATVVGADTGKALEHTISLSYASDVGNWSLKDCTLNPNVELSYLAPGDVVISVAAPDHATRWFKRTLIPGEVTDLGELRLERECTIRGILKGPVPKSAAAEVRALDISEPDAHCIATASVDWGPSGSPEWGQVGTFELHGLAGSTYLVGVARPYVGKSLVVNTSGTMQPIQLQTGTYSIVRVASRWNDERFLTVRVEDPDGHLVEVLNLGPTTDSHEDSCELEYGTYNLVCSSAGTSLGIRTIRVDRPEISVVIE